MTAKPPAADFPWDRTRPGEVEITLPAHFDAGLIFIGRIRTPFATRADCPRRGRPDGPVCRIEIDPPFRDGLMGIEAHARLEVLYFMHQARRDLIVQTRHRDGQSSGTFALRSPVRPNPIATSVVDVVGIENGAVLVRGLDCVDGTPLIDLKPDHGAFTPKAPPHP